MAQKLGLTPNEFCNRAVAYIKGLWKDDRGIPADPAAVVLPFDDSPVIRPFCEGLGVAYVVDAVDHFEYVQHRDRLAAGLDVDQLHETAVRNLANLCREQLTVRTYSNVYAFFMGGNFESSCMLVDDLFDRLLAPHVPNGYVAAAPSRDVFAVCSRDSAAGIRELREMVDRLWPGGDHLVSNTLFVREQRAWRPLP